MSNIEKYVKLLNKESSELLVNLLAEKDQKIAKLKEKLAKIDTIRDKDREEITKNICDKIKEGVFFIPVKIGDEGETYVEYEGLIDLINFICGGTR